MLPSPPSLSARLCFCPGVMRLLLQKEGVCSGHRQPCPPEVPQESLPQGKLSSVPISHSRNLCQMQEDNSSFSLLLDLLSELYQKQPKIGYHLLYYLRARWVWSRVRRCQEAS